MLLLTGLIVSFWLGFAWALVSEGDDDMIAIPAIITLLLTLALIWRGLFLVP